MTTKVVLELTDSEAALLRAAAHTLSGEDSARAPLPSQVVLRELADRIEAARILAFKVEVLNRLARGTVITAARSFDEGGVKIAAGTMGTVVVPFDHRFPERRPIVAWHKPGQSETDLSANYLRTPVSAENIELL